MNAQRGIAPVPGDEHLDNIRAALGDRAGKVWLRMRYRCQGCSAEHWVAAECGVEGPPDLRERSLFVASPFTFRCVCGGRVQHIALRDDQEFEPEPRRPDEACFVLPADDWTKGARLEHAEFPHG